ncbi:hypothetical protein [Shimia sp. SDUM112013]|uniref:hypothetical protein n=1 Tax=Shimia sp. SDUM112013 TaxID=3136160 RepID=UPI0032EB70BC
MQIVLHVGTHFTDEGRLLNSLSKNREALAERGVSLPKPSSYRRQLRTLLDSLAQTPITDALRQDFFDGLKDPAARDPDRIVMSHDDFFCVPRLAVRDNLMYPPAVDRLRDMCNLFHHDEIEVHMAIRNQATYLPALAASKAGETLDSMTQGSVPTALRWSEMVARIRENVPSIALTVWCNEDTPLIWEQLLRELCGLEATTSLEGGTDLLAEIMSQEGLERFESYVAEHEGMTEIQKRRVIAAFLDKFALEEELEEELDLPGWSEEYVDALTDIYDEDVYEISRMPGVTLITP